MPDFSPGVCAATRALLSANSTPSALPEALTKGFAGDGVSRLTSSLLRLLLSLKREIPAGYIFFSRVSNEECKEL
jgi:hypothetical protein